jgi:hypothetical protein
LREVVPGDEKGAAICHIRLVQIGLAVNLYKTVYHEVQIRAEAMLYSISGV